MEYTLTREKKDDWTGIIAYDTCNTQLGPELDKRGHIVTGLSATEARQLEKELFMQPNELAPNSPYWQTEFKIPVNGILKLDDENPQDRLVILVLKSMKKVAVGRDQLRTKSKAIYLLSSKALETKTESQKFDTKEQAWKEFFNASDKKLKQIAVVLEKSKPKGGRVTDVSSMDMDNVRNILRTNIEGNAKFFLDVAKDEKLTIKFEIIELVTHRVLSTNNSGYYQKSDLLAPDLDSMVNFMEDPHNQARVIQLKQELSVKTKGK